MPDYISKRYRSDITNTKNLRRNDDAAERPLLSIIIPVRNELSQIDKLLKSLLRQSFKDFEVLFVSFQIKNIGPSSPLFEGLSYRWIEIDSKEVLGTSTLRAEGMAAARGTYLCWVSEPTSEFAESALECMLFLAIRYDLDVCACALKIDNGSTAWGPSNWLPTLLMTQHNLIPPMAIFNRRLAENKKSLYNDTSRFSKTIINQDQIQCIKLNEEISISEYWERYGSLDSMLTEWHFWLESLKRGSLIYIMHAPLISIFLDRNSTVDFTVVPRNEIFSYMRACHPNRMQELASTDCLIAPNPCVDNVEMISTKIESSTEGIGLLVTIPFLVKRSLITHIVSRLETCGFQPTFFSTCVNSIYFPEDGPWSKRSKDVFHVHEFLPRSDWFLWMCHLIESRGISVILQAGDPYFYENLPALRTLFPNLGIVDVLFNTVGHIHKALLYSPRIDKFICENQEVFSFLIKSEIPEEKVVKIHNGVDVFSFSPKIRKSKWLELNCLPLTTQFICGFLGRFSSEKNPLAFIELARVLSKRENISFMMIGKGPQADIVREKVLELNLGSRFKLLHGVDDIVPYMSAFDVLVVPSVYDGRPIAIQEAASLGVPVIGSPVGGIPELIEEGVNGYLVDHTDIKGMATRIEFLYDNEIVLAHLRLTAREKAEREFDQNLMFEIYEETLRNLVWTA